MRQKQNKLSRMLSILVCQHLHIVKVPVRVYGRWCRYGAHVGAKRMREPGNQGGEGLGCRVKWVRACVCVYKQSISKPGHSKHSFADIFSFGHRPFRFY